MPVHITWSLAFVILCSCQNVEENRQPPIQTPAPLKRIDVVKPQAPGLKKYAPGAQTTLPTLKGMSPRRADTEMPAPKVEELKVRLLGSIQARGGTSADWIGFKPGERLFRAVWERPALEKGQDPPPPIELRVKARDAADGLKLLGRLVHIKGYWVTAPDAGTHLDRNALPAPVEFTRRKGQDLFDAAKLERQEKLQALDQKRAGPTGRAQKTPRVGLGSRGGARVATQSKGAPVFYAETFSLKSSAATSPE